MIIEKLDGSKYDIEQYGLKRLYHRIPSMNIEHNSQFADGKRTIITHSTLDTRTISVKLIYQVEDIYDFYLMRDEINDILVSEEEFYIIFKKESYKRYKVKLASGFVIDPNRMIGAFNVDFIMVNKYAESIVLTSTVKEWDVDKWAWNGMIDWDTDLNYFFNSNSFTVNNLGNATIDPRENELTIIIKGEFNSFVRITNITTGDRYQYNGSLTSTDELKLIGVRSIKNNDSVFGNTNKRLITLKKGANLFSVEGGTVNNISFDFRFLFK